MNNCDVPKCRNEVEITYYRHGVCKECFKKHCDEKSKFDLKDIFNVSPAKKKSSSPEPHQQELLLNKAKLAFSSLSSIMDCLGKFVRKLGAR